MLRHPCILGDPQTKGDNIRSGYLTSAFSGARKRAEVLRHPCILGDPRTKADKIRSGYLTSAFLGARTWRKCYVTPTFSGVPNAKRGDKIRSGPQVGTWAHRLQACNLSKIGNLFLAVRSCNFIFFVNACREKKSHRVIFFAANRVIFSLR